MINSGAEKKKKIKILFLNGFYSCQSLKDLDQFADYGFIENMKFAFFQEFAAFGQIVMKRTRIKGARTKGLFQVPAKMHVTRISLIVDKCSYFLGSINIFLVFHVLMFSDSKH